MATTKPDLDIVQELVTEFGENASYVAELLGRYRMNPASVDEEWRRFFRERLGETEPTAPSAARPAERPTPPPAAPAAREPEGETPEPLRGAALRIAENMEESLGVPMA